MPNCKNCGKPFPQFIKIDGKRIDSRRRVYCLKCNPFNERKFYKGKRTNKSMGISRKRLQIHMCPTCGRKHTNKTRNLECYNCKNKKIRMDRKNKAYIILGNKCHVCGYDNCKDALAIHHIDPSKKSFTLSMGWGLAWEQIEKEISKCVLLCCRCHAEIHNGITKLKI